MRDGFIKVCSASSNGLVASVGSNVTKIIEKMKEAFENKAKVVVFEELSLCGYTCQDLLFQDTLLDKCVDGLFDIVRESSGYKGLVIVGLPLRYGNKLYNVAAAISNGELLGLVPKKNLQSEYDEERYFASGFDDVYEIILNDENYPIGSNLLFAASDYPNLCVGITIGEDLSLPFNMASELTLNGATIICNLTGYSEKVGQREKRENLVKVFSKNLICGYISSSSGMGESTQDYVFAGSNIISECGKVLSSSKPFTCSNVYSEIDTLKIINERNKSKYFNEYDEYDYVEFEAGLEETALTRFVSPKPFIPCANQEKRFEEILEIQSQGLRKRIAHVNAKTIVVGISGGLDSCLALLVMARAMDLLARDRKDILAVSMPCFGTTSRTKSNAEKLSNILGVSFKEIDIKEVTNVHLKDLGHDGKLDVTYENAQARERTQILMDLANMYNGFVVGTGDLSELALGWATYNGDHMSMYGVNSDIPKTLVRHLVKHEAEKTNNKELSKVLLDILATPVSPELLPPKNGEISQVTEDIVGPYELHDFFLYYVVKYGYRPRKIFRLAKYAFDGEYTSEVIKKWLRNFYYRFFSQQFKRSCLPDGPKVGSVGLSPRGDFRMSSDSISKDFIEEIENL